MAEYIEREALLSHQYNKSWSRISIHAPLAGSDSKNK